MRGMALYFQAIIEAIVGTIVFAGAMLGLYLFVLWIIGGYRSKCPQCYAKAIPEPLSGEARRVVPRNLRMVGFVRATVLINGKRAPDSWSFYLCDSCGARLKFHRGQFSAPTDSEWNQQTQDSWRPKVSRV